MLQGSLKRAFSYKKVLSMESINKHVIEARYAVRGEIVQKMGEMKKQMAAGTKFPFDGFCETNIGNPQYFGQKPFTFYREVLSACLDPNLIARGVYSPDVNRRAKEYLDAFHSVGSYTESAGTPLVRNSVSDFIKKRDELSADPDSIFLGNGASEVISMAMKLINDGPNTGFMVPIPQYPLYSAEITLSNCQFTGYLLDEENGWQLDFKVLSESLAWAKSKGVDIRAIIIINPGNPTGSVFEEDTLTQLFKFAYENNLVVMSDEVYMENIYTEKKKFISAKKVLSKMTPEIRDNVELMSFHSCSKGLLGECGIRGGYTEFVNIDPEVKAQYLKLRSISLCSNTIGQIMMDLKVRPPVLGIDSSETVQQFEAERTELFESLKRRAVKCYDSLTKMKGVTAQPLEGAMYAFPRIHLSQKFIDEANRKGIVPDAYYCTKLLEEIGLVCVPGSGFKQKEGTWHYRTTILPLPEERFNKAFDELTKLNDKIMDQYA